VANLVKLEVLRDEPTAMCVQSHHQDPVAQGLRSDSCPHDRTGMSIALSLQQRKSLQETGDECDVFIPNGEIRDDLGDGGVLLCRGPSRAVERQ
jgi:hypothetical protein